MFPGIIKVKNSNEDDFLFRYIRVINEPEEIVELEFDEVKLLHT